MTRILGVERSIGVGMDELSSVVVGGGLGCGRGGLERRSEGAAVREAAREAADAAVKRRPATQPRRASILDRERERWMRER
jgi:hypothetical protein